MTKNTLVAAALVPQLLMRARQRFRATGSALGVGFYEENDFKVWGLDCDRQKDCNYPALRQDIAQSLNIPSSRFNQLIGDSASFDNADSQERSQAFYEMFRRHLEQTNEEPWLYGYTAHNEADGRLDANGAVGKYLSKNPQQAYRFVGNAVCFHTPTAVQTWGCTIADEVRALVLVHSEQGAKFGDDTITSDELTNGRVLMGEGGIQSFRQVSYMLPRGVKVFGVSNLRGERNPATFDKESGKFITYFSAAEFLNLIKKANDRSRRVSGRDCSAEEVVTIKEAYFENHPVANPARQDFSTKQGLLEKGFQQFMEQEVWKKMEHYHPHAFERGRIIELADAPSPSPREAAQQILAPEAMSRASAI